MMFGGMNQDWRTNGDRWLLEFIGKGNNSDYLGDLERNETREREAEAQHAQSP